MIELNSLQLRVIGVLIEKEITTPDQYPLSLNSIIAACNQKSNRDPVLNLELPAVEGVLDELTKKNMVSEVLFGSRVAKYKHRFCNTVFSQLHFSSRELAVLCVMFLRGPQTPGELRTRTSRLCDFRDVQEVETTLEKLMTDDQGQFVCRLARLPGKRESRYAHLFSGEVLAETNEADQTTENTFTQETVNIESRVDALSEEVAELKKDIVELKRVWADLNS